MEIAISSFQFKLTTGPTVVALTTVSAIGGYAVYKLVNNEGFMSALSSAVRGRNNREFIEDIRGGSLVVKVITEDLEAQRELLESYATGKLLQRINKSMREYKTKYGDPIEEFQEIELLQMQSKTVEPEDLIKMKQEATRNLNEIIKVGIKVNQLSDTVHMERDTTDSSQQSPRKKKEYKGKKQDDEIPPQFQWNDILKILEYNRLFKQRKYDEAYNVEKSQRPLHLDWHYFARLCDQFTTFDKKKNIKARQEVQEKLLNLVGPQLQRNLKERQFRESPFLDYFDYNRNF